MEGSDRGGGAGHFDFVGVADANADGATGHEDGDVGIDEAKTMGDGSGRTAAAAGGEGVAGTAFPDLDPNGVAVDDFKELDVGAVGEVGMGFDPRTEAVGEIGVGFFYGDNAVRVADGGGAVGKGFVIDNEGLVDDLTGDGGDGDSGGIEGNLAHSDVDEGGVRVDPASDDSAKGFDRERIGTGLALIAKVAAEYAETVTAFFGLATVGVEDAETEIGVLGREGTEEDAV